MATKLEKNLVRESSIKVDDREIIVTLTAEQEISFKLKGMRTGDVSISIEDLYSQLAGVETTSGTVENTPTKSKGGSISYEHNGKKKTSNNPMISLLDLRSYNAISSLDYETLCKFESIIVNLIENYPEKYG